MATMGCRAFTLELCRIVWPGKFKPDLPPRYEDTPDPTEFLQLYELSIEVANRDEKVMANWFPMALKDGAHTWLLNLQHGSISSWDEMRDRFIANFLGTRDRPRAICATSSNNQERPSRSTSTTSTTPASRSPRSRTRPSSPRFLTASVTSR